MAANSWWERQNEISDLANRSRGNLTDWGTAGGMPAERKMVSGPADMEAFRANFGNGLATEADYKNWAIGQQRESTMADFVNRMASQDPNAVMNADRLQGQAADFGNRMRGYLDAPAPVASNTNRFEAGLTSAESRLNNLLDNPESIQKTAAYKFRVGQGQEALQRSLGAKGLLNSGNRLTELTKYGQDMGSQEYDKQATRMADLVGGYSSSWLGDKNANTARYSAESGAWRDRGGMLKDLLGNANTAANQNQSISGNDRNAWGNTWVAANNKPGQWAPNQPSTYKLG